MADHEAMRYYRELVGEEFIGTWVGYHDEGEPRSQLWIKITISEETEKLAQGLQAIRDTFENRIWKGFDNDILYIKSLEPVGVARYRIRGCRHFVLPLGWRDSERHEDGCGYYFILETVQPQTPDNSDNSDDTSDQEQEQDLPE